MNIPFLTNIRAVFNRALRLVNPMVVIGGLEVADNFLRFFSVEDGVAKTAAVRFPPGVLRDGRIVDTLSFRAALAALHREVSPMHRPVHVVATLATSTVYSQVFGVPIVSPERLAEAVQLNLQMISPIGIARVYADAERVGLGAGGEMEYLGAFLERTTVDALAAALISAGFVLVAFEFAGLSTARLIRELGVGYTTTEPHLVITVSGSGLNLSILRGGNLYFDHFTSWRDILPDASRAIDEALFQGVLFREVQRILNFYSGKWPGKIRSAILLTRGIAPRVRAILEKNFDLTVSEFSGTRFKELLPVWSVAAGAYLRGLIPRSDDSFISLAPVGTEEAFARSRLWHFVVFWRAAMLTVCGFIFFALLFSASILARTQTSLSKTSALTPSEAELREVAELQAEAERFNASLDLALAARGRSEAWSPLLTELQKIAGTAIAFDRVLFAPVGGDIRISGRAASELSAINFKNALTRRAGFTDISLPLANIVADSDGKVTFQLTLRVEKMAP